MLFDVNLIHARAAMQVDIEEGLDWAYAAETIQIVYNLTEKELVNVILDIKQSIWYKNRTAPERN